ncbi:benzoyl-CoA reductase subunit C [Ruminiclostridium hungatei]|uniref:Benzoyl-CoA reductase subunit C n=1 Tax=Ruminiclostridium hungatei TaxID=48256 RepID=A0A1V4SM66_RUMHU|nr:2-hydroxyacyl-CoA dehydratase family protein [Ruminiclostridium hungatei]OPX44982.1 benzoyl-CoA reductase subunit C [Ruminiclostridium hungatei]
MSVAQKLFQYPETAREAFIKTEDIIFRDGSRATAEEVWKYLTEVGPVKYPNAYDDTEYHGRRISGDVTLPFSLKHNYLLLTMDDRMTKAKENGVPVIFVQGGQSVDPYYAAGGIALRPASTGIWARRKIQGLDLYQEQVSSSDVKEKARRALSFEACNTAGYEHIQEGTLPVDMVAPFSCLRCSDVSYGLEAHRHGERRDVKLFLADYPMDGQKDKEWAIEYFAENMRRLIEEISGLTGRETTAEDLRNEIKVHNEGRRLAVEIADLWWSAEVPPTNGKDRRDLFQLGGMEVHGDPQASLSLLREAKGYIAERVRKGIPGYKIQGNPARIFVCGSCVFPNEYRTEEAGGIIVGNDNHWSDIATIVEEEGDPYYNLSRAILSYPYEQSIKERAQWTVEQIKRSRADGVLFLYNWGCNTQSAIARALVDEIKKETGLPTLIIEHDRGSEQLQNRVNAFVEMLK